MNITSRLSQRCLKPVLTALILTLGFGCISASAAESRDTTGTDNLRVFIDCHRCDDDYLRTEIGFVDFVRDRKLADVHVLVSTQGTGSGGTEYTVEFIGMGTHQGESDTLRFAVLEADSDDTIRREMARTIKLGVMRYAVKTPAARHLSISYDQPTDKKEAVDQWNYWVFEVSGNSWLSGEDSYHSVNLWGEVTARRVTEASHVRLRAYLNYSESKFEYTIDDEMISTLSISRSRGFSGHWLWSLGDHWSAGGFWSAYTSTYSNRDIDISAGPGLEFNVFPYSESTRRQLRFIYQITPHYVDYTAETIFDKAHEWLGSQSLSVELELIQPWGSVESQLSASHYLHDIEKNYLQWWNRLSLQLFKGFSLNLDGNISRVRNLLNLPKGDASEEEVLLRRRQLATDYEFWGSIGISYSFGSIYNSVVNPRFGY